MNNKFKINQCEASILVLQDCFNYIFFNFIRYFETGFLFVTTLAVLEFALKTRLALTQETYLPLPPKYWY